MVTSTGAPLARERRNRLLVITIRFVLRRDGALIFTKLVPMTLISP